MIAEAVELPTWAFQLGAWAAGTGAVVAALIRLVPKFGELWFKIRTVFRSVDEQIQSEHDRAVSLRNIRRWIAVEGVCARWVVRKGAQRCLGLIANNGGEAWRGKGPMKVSNPAQAIGPGNKNTRNEWQEWSADGWYIAFLGRLLETLEPKRGMLLVRDVDVDGELAVAYKSQGTVASVVLPFKWEYKSALWYVSINFGRPLAPGEDDIPDKDKAHFVQAARSVYDNPGKCRELTDQLIAAYNSVR